MNAERTLVQTHHHRIGCMLFPLDFSYFPYHVLRRYARSQSLHVFCFVIFDGLELMEFDVILDGDLHI